MWLVVWVCEVVCGFDVIVDVLFDGCKVLIVSVVGLFGFGVGEGVMVELVGCGVYV